MSHKLNVTIDISPAVNGKAGLGRYAASLAEGLAADHAGSIHLFANRTSTGDVPGSLSGIPLTLVNAGYKPWRMAVLMAQMMGVRFDRMLPPSTMVFHATEHLLLPVARRKAVLTVHDLIFKLLPQHHKKLNYWYLNAAMPLFVRRADHVIAVSDSTKRDIIREYGTPDDKITVVYEAAAPHFIPQNPEKIAGVRKRYNLPERYLLSVGTIEPRKNLSRVVEALAALRRDDPDLSLVVVGSEGWLTEGFHAAIAANGQQDAVIRPGYVPDEDLPAVYAGASVSVLASLYEGFGLPVLEAMACGSPVACSSTSSVGEIAGDAAVTFHPEDVRGMVEAMSALLGDDDLRDRKRQEGFARAAEFSWQRTARETWAVYERLTAAEASA